MAKFLRPYFTVVFVRRSDNQSDLAKKITNTKAIIYSVPMVGLEQSIIRTKPFVTSDMLIIDVTSVKVKPLQLLKAEVILRVNTLKTTKFWGPIQFSVLNQ